MWTIHSIGDSAYLAEILNAVAMIAGTGELAVSVRIGFGLGVLLLAFSAVMHAGRGVQWQQIIVAWVAYAALFGPGLRVAVEDAYTDQVIVVDNVPFGVAATGSMLSSVGYTLTNLFETAFSSPAFSEQGYGMSLKRLATARQALLSRIAVGSANRAGGAGSDTEKSWTNYIIECTLAGIDLGIKSLDEVLQGPLPESLRFADGGDWYYTEIYTGGAPRTLRCDTAFDQLDAYTDAVFLPAVKQNLTALLGADGGLTTDEMLADALAGVQQDSLDVNAYLKAIYLTPIYYESVVAKHEIDGKHTYAVMVNNAIQQRNAQWRAQKSVFETSVQPLLTFVEGFFYAITPIMALVIGLGPMGLSMAGKYLSFALWIQFWMPLMAIVNAYLHMAASGEMAAMTAMASEVSLSGVLHWDGILQHYLAVGGMLATSVPLLALFIVTGSYYAMTHFSGKIEGADHVNEKLAAPDAVARAPLFAMDSHMRMDPTMGARGTGTDEIIGSTSFSDLRQTAMASASQRLSTAQQSFSQTMSSTLGAAWQKAQESHTAQSFGAGLETNYGRTWGQVEQLSDKISEQFGLDRTVARQIAGDAAFSGGASVNNYVSGSMGVSISSSQENREKLARAVGYANDMARSEEFRGGLARSLSQDIRDGFQDRGGFTLSDQDSRALSRASSEVISAQESYTATDTATQGWSGNKSIGNLAVVNAVGDQAIGLAVVSRHLQRLQGEFYTSSYAGLVRRGALTHEQAAGLSGLDALRHSSREPGRDRESIAGDRSVLLDLVRSSGLAAPGDAADPGRNANLEVPDASGLRAATAGAGGAAAQAAGVRGAVAQDRAERQGLVSSGPGLVEGGDGKGAYRGLAEHAAAASRVAHLDQAIHEQNAQLDAMVLERDNRNAPAYLTDGMRWIFARDDPRIADALDEKGPREARFDAISGRGQELGLSKPQADYVAAMSLNRDGNAGAAVIKRDSGLSQTEMGALDAWMGLGGNQYLDRVVEVNRMTAERDALIDKHDLVQADDSSSGPQGLQIMITGGGDGSMRPAKGS